jgi:hypothetical protein
MLVRPRAKQMALRIFDVLPVEPLRRVMVLKGGCHPVIWVFHWVRIEVALAGLLTYVIGHYN